jgi:long-chain acyl-CoA synthetase
MPRQSIAEYLEGFRSSGRDIAFVHRRGYRTARWSYRHIAETAAQAARLLEARGVGKGDRVLLWGENCPEWVAGFFGCALRGAVAVPMDRIATPEFARRVAAQVQARLALGSQEQLAALREIPALAFEQFADQLAGHSAAPYAGPPTGRDDVLEIIFTSGATADPKGVVLTHGNVLANLTPLETEIAKYLKYERLFHPVRFLNLLPLSHVFGQFMGMFVPQLLRGAVYFQESLNPSEILRAIRRERISVLVTVPRVLESLKEKLERDAESAGQLAALRRQMEAAADLKFTRRWWRFRRFHNLFGWKFWAFVSGGAALDAATEEFWRRLSFVVVQGYGMTETTSLISVNHPFGVGRGSIGKVLPGREMKLSDTGEILVRGESIASAYWQGGEMQPVAGGEGWLRTGDLGAVDEAGNLYFKGRQKNVIVTPEGMNVYPEDVENVLRRQAAVRDCVVLPLRREGNAVPCAVLLLREPGADGAAVVRAANAALADYQQIRYWRVWPEVDFPRTATQKPRTGAILAWVEAQRGTAATAPVAASVVSHAGSLADLVARIARRPAGDVRPDAALATELNLSSLDRVELLSAIEDRFQVDLNESQFTAATTLGDLEKMLHAPAAARSDHHYPRWAQRPWMQAIRVVVYYLLTWPATQLLSWPRIHGRDKLRAVHGPVLVVCNHITYTDVGFVLAALPPRLRQRLAVAMEGERVSRMRRPPPDWTLWERLIFPPVFWLMTALFNVFPLPQRAGFRESFQFAGESVDRGYSVLVFPEGARTPDGQLAPFRSGIGLLVNNLRLPVVPMRIDGLWELKARGRRVLAPPGAISVTVGDVMQFQPGTDPGEIAQRLEAAVRSLPRR